MPTALGVDARSREIAMDHAPEPGAAARQPTADATPNVEALARRLMSESRLQIGTCSLTRNPVCDCVLGVDPLGIETVAAYTACDKGCRDAVIWALRASRTPAPRPH
jgi:hypothetical protein